ncbi:MAG: flagellar hook-associated protein FlgK, partial [Hyphomicrobiales bacterium]|nr:flagellar hook-associated protein FlgK [Hyphomicrobiales bacterium]
TSTQHTVTFIAVNDPASLPLDDGATADPNDTVYGIDFSGGMAAAAAQIGAALGAGFTVSNPAGTTLRILDDGAANTTDVDGLSTSVTQTSLTAGVPELPFFVDRGTYSQYYTGSFDGGSQKLGFAQRITVNSNLVADPSRLVVYSTAPQTASGDATRPMLLVDRLNTDGRDFSLAIKATGQARSFAGSIGDYMREVVSFQGSRSEIAQRQAEGQEIVVNSLRERFHDTSGVDIDQELARLTQLQTSYAANARVMSTVKEMLDILMQM